jgi:hypothetical protein
VPDPGVIDESRERRCLLALFFSSSRSDLSFDREFGFSMKIQRPLSSQHRNRPNHFRPKAAHGFVSVTAQQAILNSLTNDRDALPAADAGSRQPITPTPSLQFMQQSQNQARTGRAEWMTESNRTSVDVGFLAIQT